MACEKRQNIFSVVVGPFAGCVGWHFAITADSSVDATTNRLHLCGEVEPLWNVRCRVITRVRGEQGGTTGVLD